VHLVSNQVPSLPESPMKAAQAFEQVQRIIVLVRGRRVILDADLAELYGVENRVLLQAVKRNMNRFPADFMTSCSS
jgi:hypothetical protein